MIVVVDASNLQRNLYLVSQLIELGRPLIVALNMMDMLRSGGGCGFRRISYRSNWVCLSWRWWATSIRITPLKEAISRAKAAPMPDWSLPQPMKMRLGALAVHYGKAGEAIACSACSPVVSGFLSAIVLPTLPRTRASADPHLVDAHHVRLQLGIDPMQADIEAHYHWIDDVAAGATTRQK